MDEKYITDAEQIKSIAESYSIPPECVETVITKECVGGYSYTVVKTSRGDGWEGCGHTMCSMCPGGSAGGLVGDDAVRAFWDIWMNKARIGIKLPSYITKQLAWRIDKLEKKLGTSAQYV
ncbi:MAG: hypothetical protein KAT00_01425 [Planctomycetes bacterium]|nr:hypothetical protein [Planctomycetota bacterium]